jgi:hypothetical protein
MRERKTREKGNEKKTYSKLPQVSDDLILVASDTFETEIRRDLHEVGSDELAQLRKVGNGGKNKVRVS